MADAHITFGRHLAANDKQVRDKVRVHEHRPSFSLPQLEMASAHHTALKGRARRTASIATPASNPIPSPTDRNTPPLKR